MEKTLAELVREYKGGNEKSFEKIAEKMNPMIMFYAGKLYTWEQEDARQEMLLTLFCSLKKMKYCKSEGECLSYIRTAVRRRYKDLVLKELHNQNKTVHTEWMEVQDTNDQLGEAEFYMDLEITLLGFRGKERKIAERMLLYGENDKELARYEGVSRQYCNKIRKKFIKKM